MKVPFINLYSDLLRITSDVCSAQILELFEKWTLVRFKEGDKDFWLYTGISNIKGSIYGDFARNRIIRCLEDLHQKGFIESKASSETRDKTRLYKLNVESIESAIKKINKSGGVA